jgi:hypothetical protein
MAKSCPSDEDDLQDDSNAGESQDSGSPEGSDVEVLEPQEEEEEQPLEDGASQHTHNLRIRRERVLKVITTTDTDGNTASNCSPVDNMAPVVSSGKKRKKNQPVLGHQSPAIMLAVARPSDVANGPPTELRRVQSTQSLSLWPNGTLDPASMPNRVVS